jgi:hypothetical protein
MCTTAMASPGRGIARLVPSTTDGTLHTVGINPKKSCPQSAVWLGDDKIFGFAGRVGKDMIYWGVSIYT